MEVLHRLIGRDEERIRLNHNGRNWRSNSFVKYVKPDLEYPSRFGGDTTIRSSLFKHDLDECRHHIKLDIIGLSTISHLEDPSELST